MVTNRSKNFCNMAKVILLAVPLAILCAFIIEVSSKANSGDAHQQHTVKRVIVDVDTGADDAWALFYLLRSHGVIVEAISCVKGNTNVTNVGRNVLRILMAMGKEDKIPVFLGSNERLITPEPVVDPSDMYFGSDGFSDIEFPDLPTPNMTLLRSSAISELHKIVIQYPHEITFICLGPLTNLALLLKVYPEARDLIKDVFIMGGNRHGVGNTGTAAEFNFFNDPEGANIVINSFHGPITVLPWETASRENLMMEQAWRFDVLGNTSNPVVQILNPVEKKALGKDNSWMPCDLLVPMMFTNPEIVTSKTKYPGNVELHGWLTRGQLVLNHEAVGTGNVTIVDNMNREEVQEMLMKLIYKSS